MSALLPAVVLLVIAAITPGPNNVLVLDAAMRRGPLAAACVAMSVIAGSLLLFTLVALGLGTLLEQSPAAKTAIVLAGAAWLGWFGFRMMAVRQGPGKKAAGAPDLSFTAIAVFQLTNPKAWALVGIFVATARPAADWPLLALVLAAVTGICLATWAVAGMLLNRVFSEPSRRRPLDIVLGGSIVLFAGLILVQQFGGQLR